jgi:hypothetical protein
LLENDDLAVFNAYRKENPGWIPDFSGMDLSNCDLEPVLKHLRQ